MFGFQPALYGASSLGGLIKFVTKDPSTTDGFTGSITAGANTVSYNLRGSANIPINDTIALRASAFTVIRPRTIDLDVAMKY